MLARSFFQLKESTFETKRKQRKVKETWKWVEKFF